MSPEESKHITCPNCKNSFESSYDYCPYCGQKNHKMNLHFKYFISEVISGMFNLDSKIFRTLSLLILHPGALTNEFLAGKRASYIPPVRLYLIISLVYFTVISMVNTNIVKNSENGEADKIAADSISSAVADSSGLKVRDTTEKTQVITFDNLGDLDQVLTPESDTINDSIREGKWDKIVKNRLNKLKSKEGKEEFTQSFRKYVNLGMFLLMPLTALIFYLLFMKGTFYIQHLVFVLHLQSAMYILFTIFNIIELGVQSDWIDMALAILFFSLLYTWIKKFYEIGWAKAIFKSLLFLFLYTFLFGIFMGMIGILSAWNL